LLQRNAGLGDPHSLHISILICQGINASKAVGAKTAAAAVKNNFFSLETHSELDEDRAVSFYNNKIDCEAWCYKAAKAAWCYKAGKGFAARLNRQVVQATDNGDTE